jgi:hypothetical protein
MPPLNTEPSYVPHVLFRLHREMAVDYLKVHNTTANSHGPHKLSKKENKTKLKLS